MQQRLPPNLVDQIKYRKISDLSLTFDCTLFIGGIMLAVTICFSIPYVTFDCTIDGSVLAALAALITQQNIYCRCSMQGFRNFIFVPGTFWFISIFSFSVFRYVKNPKRPLFGTHKCYYHILAWIIIFSLSIGSVSVEMYANLTYSKNTKTNVLYPLMICASIFGIFTPCSMYFTIKRLKHESKINSASSIVRDFANLSIIMYQFFVGSAVILFLIIVDLCTRQYDIEYLFCLFDTELFEGVIFFACVLRDRILGFFLALLSFVVFFF